MFTDKYSPKSLAELDFNDDANLKLQRLAKQHEFPHLLLDGHRGSGKRTRALLYLRERYGNDIFEIKNCRISIEVNGTNKKNIELQTLISPYHYQFNPHIHGVYDRTVLGQFIDQIVKHKRVDKTPYRIVIIEDADLLTHEAQQSIRRTMEDRVSMCRFIFLSNRENKIIPALYSRCIQIQTSLPSEIRIKNIINKVLANEQAELTEARINKIIERSERNLNVVLHLLQKSILAPKDCLEPDFNLIVKITELIANANKISDVEKIRGLLYELQVHGLPLTEILRKLNNNIVRTLSKPDSNRPLSLYQIYKINSIASERDISLRKSNKELYHLEDFCVKVIQIIQSN